MPDPRDPTPVKAVQRGSVWTVVGSDGKQLPEAGSLTEEKARALAARVNATWAGAKKERVAKGGPAVTEGRAERVARRADAFGRILG